MKYKISFKAEIIMDIPEDIPTEKLDLSESFNCEIIRECLEDISSDSAVVTISDLQIADNE